MPVTLSITLNSDGRVTISGPIDNKMLCYGLLESAKDAIRDYSAQQQNRIVAPDTATIGLLKN